MENGTGTKPWWLSLGVNGSLAATVSGVVVVLAAVAGAAGYQFGPEDQELLVTGVVGAIGAVSGIIGVIGRVLATKRIG